MFKLWIPFIALAGLTATTLQSGPLNWRSLARDLGFETRMDVSAIRQEVREINDTAGSAEGKLKDFWHELRHK